MNLGNKVNDSLHKPKSSTKILDDEKPNSEQQESRINLAAEHNKEQVVKHTTVVDEMGGSNKEESSKLTKELEAKGFAVPSDEDILSGRGTGINLHPGNVFFRKLIQSHKEQYIHADPARKRKIIKEVMQKSNQEGNRRYLKHDFDTDLYIQISEDEIRKKIGQALRENAPAIKRRQHDQEALEKMKRRWREQQHKHDSSSELGGMSFPGQFSSLQPLRTALDPASSTAANGSASCSTSTGPFAPSSFTKSTVSMTSPHLNPLHSAAASSASNMIPFIPSTAENLWTQLDMLIKKQNRLRIKQREIEDEQDELMHLFYRMIGTFSTLIDQTNLVGTTNDDVASDANITGNVQQQSQGRPSHQPQHLTSSSQNYEHQYERQQQFSFPAPTYPMTNNSFQMNQGIGVATEATQTVAEAVAAASAALSEPSRKEESNPDNSDEIISSNADNDENHASTSASTNASPNNCNNIDTENILERLPKKRRIIVSDDQKEEKI